MKYNQADADIAEDAATGAKMTLYSILKDDKPENTITKIKSIIKNLKINLSEEFFIDKDDAAPVSVRLSITKYPLIGTNGKGTSKENALASAYAEFIERLQNLIIFPNTWEYAYIIPDATSNKKNTSEKYFEKKILVYEKIKNDKGNFDKLLYCPYFSITNKKVCNLPYNILARIKGSNGMSAGNTFEEAIVQGLAEICERYALKEVLLNKKSLPDIPEEKYLKYKNIKNIISYFNKNGFNIYVKDASLNGKIPVVCTIIEDVQNNVFCPSFGAHPSLPIAIERTLTEFTQGMMLCQLRILNQIGYQCYSKQKLKYTSLENIHQSLCLYKMAFEKTKKLKNIFFNANPSFLYCDDIWIDEKTPNNKTLLKFLKERILNIADDIYIRDVSFLGFPSVDIFAPNMSEFFEYNEKNLKKRNLDRLWATYHHNPDKNSYNIDSLLDLAETFSFTETLNSKKIFNVPFEYIALLCSIVKKDTSRIIKYADILLAQNKLMPYYSDEQILTFKIIKDYFKNTLNDKYNKRDISYAVDVINNLNFELVLEIVIKKEKIKLYTNKKFFERLEKLYKKNLPNQLELKRLFE